MKRFHPHGHAHPSPRGPADLRSRGRRLTRQRALIWAALTAEPDAHVSALEVAAHVQAELPGVNLSTIYRTLDLLVSEGLVLRTELGAGQVVYEPAHDHLHHHVVCRSCGAVAHVHDEVLGDLSARVDAACGFALGGEEITLFAHCPACRYRGREAGKGARMSEQGHTHDHPHTHEHSHGDATHSHPHTSHDHGHTEHEHEHRHGDLVHSHPHVHEAGREHDDEHEHEH